MNLYVKRNGILLLVLIILLLGEVLFSSRMLRAGEAKLGSLKETIQETRDANPDGLGDVEGYGVLLYSLGYGLGALGIALLWIFLVVIPLLYNIVLGILTLLATFLFGRKKSLTGYRVLLALIFIWLLLGMIGAGSLLFTGHFTSVTVVLILVEIYVLITLIYMAWNSFLQNPFPG